MSSNSSALYLLSGNKGYGQAGASHTKRALKGFVVQSGSPHEDIDLNNYTLRQRGRMLYMSQPIAASAVKTNRTNVIGLGLQLDPKIDREFLGLGSKETEEWQRRVKMEFSIWADKKETCDATGMNNFYSMQQLALISWLVSGDVFVLRKEKKAFNNAPYRLRLHIIEADRCSTPYEKTEFQLNMTTGKADNGNKIYDGVEVGKDGNVEAYYFSNTYPYEMTAEETKWIRVKAYGDNTGLPNVLHVMNSERPDQYRGVTYLAQIIEPLLQLKRYTESELVAAVVQSFMTAFITTDASTDMTGNPLNVAMEGEQERYDPSEYAMGAGNIIMLNRGENVVFSKPTQPNTGFDTFVNAVCIQIGAALEIPKDLLMKEFGSSYSASRAALLEAWKSFKMYRTWFIDDFCNPVYEIWLSEAVASGRISAPGFFEDPLIRKAWLGCEWIGPSQGQLDPVKEVKAEIMAVQHGFTTHEDATMRLNGGDWNNNMDQLAREYEKLKKVAPVQLYEDEEDEKEDEEKDEEKVQNNKRPGRRSGGDT
ncbi:phage portal protein [Lachnospiraceae bacterium]|jgi:lambda family phage portal protein|nr:phage portal protein [Lachnospiraceae bacterium]